MTSIEEIRTALLAAVKNVDMDDDPARLEAGARLLGEVKEAAREQDLLAERVRLYIEESEAGRPVATKSLADWAEEVLLSSDGARRYREIAAEIRARGFRHARVPKSPDQLADSVWTAMYEDPRFVKVGRGIWDLVIRRPDAAAGDDG